MTGRAMRAVQGVLVAGTGLATAFLASTGAYGAYLKVGMRYPLLGAGLVMFALGLSATARAALASSEGRGDGRAGHHHDPDDHHAHARGMPRVAWLLLLPLVAAVALRPPALGADAVRRDAGAAPAAEAPSAGFAPLPPPRDGAVDMANAAFVSRARYDPGRTLAGVRVRLTGFVVRDPAIDDGYQLTRFVMACCAGDALPASVRVTGLSGPVPPDDTWVEVVAKWAPPEGAGAARPGIDVTVRAISQVEIEPPTFPYE